MISIVILGSGNMATHLYNALKSSISVNVVQRYARNLDKLAVYKNEVSITDNLSSLLDADMYLLAISDDAIAEVSRHLISKEGLVVHTSGSTNLEALSKNIRRGCFYPLQTFTKDAYVDFEAIPICIEAKNEKDFLLLQKLAGTLSKIVVPITSEQRQVLHLAAVFVNNFTNHLYHIGNEICESQSLPFDLLKPLILETAQKIKNNTPLSAQTGPAKRNDIGTLEKHQTLLQQDNHKEIYSVLSESIKNTYGQKL